MQVRGDKKPWPADAMRERSRDALHMLEFGISAHPIRGRASQAGALGVAGLHFRNWRPQMKELLGREGVALKLHADFSFHESGRARWHATGTALGFADAEVVHEEVVDRLFWPGGDRSANPADDIHRARTDGEGPSGRVYPLRIALEPAEPPTSPETAE